jgi:hypothetical protein
VGGLEPVTRGEYNGGGSTRGNAGRTLAWELEVNVEEVCAVVEDGEEEEEVEGDDGAFDFCICRRVRSTSCG